MMRGLHKSKRVSWAPDVSLCQVKLFLSEESPSQVGISTQDHLQAKTSWMSHSSGTGADDILPPGFEGAHSASQFQVKVLEIPQIKWRCPPKFGLDPTWLVVAGEESKEVVVENQRELREFEAVYPRSSAIPPNPSFSTDMEGSHNDHQTPLIPITPIEDEDAAADCVVPSNVPISPQLSPLASGVSPAQSSIPSTSVNEKSASGIVHNVEPDIARAAYAAVAAITKSNEHGNLIDHDLLIKILSDPKLIEKLLTDHGAATNTQNAAKLTMSSISLSNAPPPVTLHDPSSLHANRMETSAPSLAATSSEQFYPLPNGVGVGHLPNARVPPPGAVPASPSPSVGVTQTKDVNYYKNLIQQHGGERQQQNPQQFGNRFNPDTPQQFGNRFNPDTPQQFGNRFGHQPGTNHESINNPRPRDSKPKINKPCIYFNSSRGCRNGANCSYQHDASSQQRGGGSMPEVPNAKRMKMDREISS